MPMNPNGFSFFYLLLLLLLLLLREKGERHLVGGRSAVTLHSTLHLSLISLPVPNRTVHIQAYCKSISSSSNTHTLQTSAMETSSDSRTNDADNMYSDIESGANNGGALSYHSVPNLSLVESNSSDRAYGTFEVSVIDLETESNDGATPRHGGEAMQHAVSEDRQHCGMCSQDCCFLMAFVFSPIRLQTYRVLLFHLANFVFAVVAVIWTLAMHIIKLLTKCKTSWSVFSRRLETQSFRLLLESDTALFNFISPRHERVMVYSSSASSFQDVSVFLCFYAQLYFGIFKFVCSATPGLISAAMFLWSLQQLVLISLCPFDSSCSVDVPASLSSSFSSVVSSAAAGMFRSGVISFSSKQPHHLATADQDYDILVCMSVLTVYASTMLLQVFAYISRHVTIFFCAEHLVLLHAA